MYHTKTYLHSFHVLSAEPNISVGSVADRRTGVAGSIPRSANILSED